MVAVQEKSKKPQEPPYSLQNLGFYFDSLSQDRIDRGMLSRKAGQILNLREKLMQLPEPEFETTVKTIAKFVETILPAAVESQKSKAPVSNQVRREAIQVFERAAEESKVASKKPTLAAESVARIS